MGHPYKEPGKVISDYVPPPFTPKRALEIMRAFRPKRDEAKKKAKEKKLEEKRLLKKENNEKKEKAVQWAKSCWSNIEKEIEEEAKKGNTRLDVKTHSKPDAKALVTYARSLSWQAKRDVWDGSYLNPTVAIYWGRFAWLRMRLTMILIATAIVFICFMLSKIGP